MNEPESVAKETPQLVTPQTSPWMIANSVLLICFFFVGLIGQRILQSEDDGYQKRIASLDALDQEYDQLSEELYSDNSRFDTMDLVSDAMIQLGESARPFDNDAFAEHLPKKPLPDDSPFVFFNAISFKNKTRLYLPARRYKLIIATQNPRGDQDWAPPAIIASPLISGPGWTSLRFESEAGESDAMPQLTITGLDPVEIETPHSFADHMYTHSFYQTLRTPKLDDGSLAKDSVVLETDIKVSNGKKVKVTVRIALEETSDSNPE